MTISFLSLALIIVFLAIPAFVFYANGIRLATVSMKAVGRMLCLLLVFGGTLYLLTKWDNALLNVVFAFLLTLLSAFCTAQRSHATPSNNFVAVLASIALPTLAASALVTLAIGGDLSHFSSRTFAILTGILSGSVIVPCGKALRTYRAGLRNHGQLYCYLTGNGASRQEALAYMKRRALTAAAMPGVKWMGTLYVATTPTVLWCLSLSGVGVLEAVTYQVLLLAASWCISLCSTLLFLFIAQRWGIDEYSRFKP